MSILRKLKSKLTNKKGLTMAEVITMVAIIGIIIAIIVVNVMRLVTQAYMTRANDSAEVVYMAMQSSLTDLKANGNFDEVFSKDMRNQAEGKGYYAIPEEFLKGEITAGGITVPGVVDKDGVNLWDILPDTEENKKLIEYRERLLETESLVYMKLNYDGTDKTKEGYLLYDLLAPYISDRSLLDYSILVEINLENKTVRCAFYTERSKELVYGLETGMPPLTEATLKKDKDNVLLRDYHPELYDKRQGYYGHLGVGEPDNLGMLENAYVKVRNDDMLTIEWGEIAPTNENGVDDKKRARFTNMSYDVKIVNAHNTNEIYYEVNGITPYQKDDKYADTNKANISNPLIPIYDLYNYDKNNGVNNALNANLMSSFETIEHQLQADGKRVPVTQNDKKHRLSYYVPEDIGGEAQYGVFRLVLDSITTEGDDDFSINKAYPEIPWDEDFKVIVEGKYLGEGFTGSLSITDGKENGYMAEKVLNPAEDMYFDGQRGASVIEEIRNYLVNGSGLGSLTRSNMWYEVGYARHLNNMRYIVGHEERTDWDLTADLPKKFTKKEGNTQNFLLVDDIDWSIQKIGVIEQENSAGDIEILHHLTVSNAEGNDLTVSNAENLREFAPISTFNKDIEFEGKLLSEVKKDKDGEVEYLREDEKDQSSSRVEIEVDGVKKFIPLYNEYNISYLKLSPGSEDLDNKNSKYTGIFDVVGEYGYLRDFVINGVVARGNNDVGAVAGEFKGYAKNLTLKKNTEPNEHKQIRVISKDNYKEENVKVNGSDIKVEPSAYPANHDFTGNAIVAR